MIHLIGVQHNILLANPLTGDHQDLEVRPSDRLLVALYYNLPENSRVGVEFLPPGEWKEYLRDLVDLAYTLHIPFNTLSTKYFDCVQDGCRELGREIVYLDDKECMLRYNQGLIQVVKIRAELEELFENEGEMPRRDYVARLYALNEELFHWKLRQEKIQLLDRDELMLQRIASSNLDAVVAGVGHTDPWFLHREDLIKQGIEFGKYSTDTYMTHLRRLSFTENAIPDPRHAFEFESVRRGLRLFEKGSLSDTKPDWVGTWMIHTPSEGYFELFIEERNGSHVRGRIEDLVGSSVFEGEITPRQATFVKTYVRNGILAATSKVEYRSELAAHDRDYHRGFYRIGGFGGEAFYMEKPNGSTPLGLSVAFHDLMHDEEVGQQRLF